MESNSMKIERQLMLRIGLILLLTIILFCCKDETILDPADQIPYKEGLTTNNLNVNGNTRKYLVYRPSGISSVRAVVTVLHGGGGLGLDVAELGVHPLSVFRTVADKEKFLVVYPEGSPDIQGNFGWNDCRSDDASGSRGDDLTFLKQLNSKLSSELKIESAQHFLTGTSNGALMTFTYAFHFPESLNAIAVSSGNLPQFPESGSCSEGSSIPIPILLNHGTSDPAMPFNGGCVANLGGACNRGKVVSQSETLNYWLTRNKLNQVTPTITQINLTDNDAGSVEKLVYSGEKKLIYYILRNAGHAVASKTVFLNSSTASGIQNRDIEFAEEVWSFFREL